MQKVTICIIFEFHLSSREFPYLQAKKKQEKTPNGSDMATAAHISHIGSLASAPEGEATPRICRAPNAFAQLRANPPALPHEGNRFSSPHGAALQSTQSTLCSLFRAAPSKV